jgi:tetratricopeptide (TPR) repeat protein
MKNQLLILLFLFIQSYSFADFNPIYFSDKDKDLYEQYAQTFLYAQGSEIRQNGVQNVFDQHIQDTIFRAEVLRELSIWYIKTGNFAKEMVTHLPAIELDPKQQLNYAIFIKLYYLRDYEAVIKDIYRLDALTPNFVDQPWAENMYYLLGLCHMQLEKYSIAIQYFDSCLATYTSVGIQYADYKNFLYKGICFLKNKQYEKAIESFDKTIELFKNCSDAYYWKSVAYIALKNKSSALSCIELAKQNQNYLIWKQDAYHKIFIPVYEWEIDALKLKIQTKL